MTEARASTQDPDCGRRLWGRRAVLWCRSTDTRSPGAGKHGECLPGAGAGSDAQDTESGRVCVDSLKWTLETLD